MSGIEVVGLISAVISIVETIVTVYNGVRDAQSLPQAFRDVAEKLPLVLDTLQVAERHIEANTDEEACRAMLAVVENCKDKAEQLKEIFNTIALTEHPSRLDRYRVAVRRLGKGHRVEELGRDMIEGVRHLAVNHAVRAATEAQVAELLKAVEELSTIETSLPDEDTLRQYHSGSGDNVGGNKYQGNHNVFSGSGDAYYAPVTQNVSPALPYQFNEKECVRDLFLTHPCEDMQALKRKKGRRAKGTCDWILKTGELTSWLGDDPESTLPPTDVLWLHGNPGAGKSTMSIFLSEALSKAFFKTPNKTLAYFFCDSGYDMRKTATAIVRGLLLQLVRRHPRLIEHVLCKYEEQKARAFDSFDALWGMFLKVCADTATGRKYCIIDALDECEGDEQETILKQIEETFGRDRSSTARLNVSILVTSRPYPEIMECLQDFPNRDLASFEESRQDIDKFIDEKMDYLKNKKSYTDGITAKVTQMLRNKAGGIFLWVGLACQELEKVPSKDAITLLEKIPSKLQSLYKQLLDAALQQDAGRGVVKRLLGIVLLARRPLTPRELAAACELYQDEGEEERIQFTTETIASCRLIIVVHDYKVLLLHQSVRDFLVGDISDNKQFIHELQIHNWLASRCVSSVLAKYSGPKQGHAKGDDLISYATQFWPEHAHLAKNEFQIEDRQAKFFAIDSRSLDSWWKDYPKKPYGEPSFLTIFHVAARWGIPSLVDHALAEGNSPTGTFVHGTSPRPYIDSAYRDSTETTPLVACASTSHIEVFRTMLQRADGESHLEAEVTKAAAGNWMSGAEMMKVLLDQRGNQITITQAIVEAAAGNLRSGAEVMKVLLDQSGDQVITITEDIIKAVARKWQSGADVLKVLLDRKVDQVTMTEVAITAMASKCQAAGMIEALLDWKGDQVTIIEEVVKAAAANWMSGAEVMKVLLDQRGDQITITEAIVEAAARNPANGAEVMKLLLHRTGDPVKITESGIAAVAGYFGAEVMKVLLDRKGDQVTITADTVMAAAGNSDSGVEVMKLLLHRSGDQVKITESGIAAVAGYFGAEVIKVLLDRKRDQVTITEDTVMAAAGNSDSGVEVMRLLLDRTGNQVMITEDIVKAAAAPENWSIGTVFMKLLLNRIGDQVTITEGAIAAVARYFGVEVIKVLLDRKGDQITITEDIVKAAAGNWYYGAKVMTILLDMEGHQVTITKDTIKAAAGNFRSGAEVMKLLLDRTEDRVEITDDIVRAAAREKWSGIALLGVLFDHRGEVGLR